MIADFKLRDYQIDALDAVDGALRQEKYVLMSAIMGAGKTVMAARLIRAYWFKTDRRLLVLAHKKELVEQFSAAFRDFTDVPEHGIGICCAGLGQKDIDRRLTIGTIQTFCGLVGDYPGCDLMVVDECHNIDMHGETQYSSTIRALKNKIPDMRVLGITATPFRLGHGYIYGDRCRPKAENLFKDIHYKIGYSELKSAGHLAPLRGEVAHADELTDDLENVNVNGDYVLDQLGEIMVKEIHLHTAVEAIKKFCGKYKRIAVFCVTIDHAEKLQALISEEIEPCAIIHSGLTNGDRNKNLDDWKDGTFRICTSINILAEGFDFPPLDCLVFVRPTVSARLYLQAVGRVLRTSPGTGKDHGFLLDLTDNTARFGTDLDNVRVPIPKAIVKEFEDKNPLLKLCPGCDAELHKSIRICPECGWEWSQEEVIIADVLPSTKEVWFEKAPPELVKVDGMRCSVWHAKSDKMLGKIELSFNFGVSTVSVWMCFSDFYDGYALDAGGKKWAQFSDHAYPESCEEFNGLLHTIRQPVSMALDTSGKYAEIEELFFDEGETGADRSRPELTEAALISHAELQRRLGTLDIDNDDIPF